MGTNAHLVTPAVLDKRLADAVSISPLRYLGDVIGGARYLGQCLFGCCQFMSTHTRVAELTFSYDKASPSAPTYQRTVCCDCHSKIVARLQTPES